MKNWMLFGALMYLGGCASHSCDSATSDAEPSGSECREGYLLYRNDMLQAKLLVSQANPDNYELAHALLRRAAKDDPSGEADFYQAVLMIREHGDQEQIIDLLHNAASHRHPLAIALLSQQLSLTDPKQAEHYRAEYAELDVAKSGYPSFEQAVVVVRGLILPTTSPPASK
ncbi:MAG: hypothetical protein K0R45_1410 [Pseudomonas sp.]|jgi:hypothetical protein|nr:hypothetical protein [Pseudomonas sp.]